MIGYGSPLHSDDRLGWLVAEELEAMVGSTIAEIAACTQLTPEYAQPVSQAEGVAFIDASAELPPGHIACVALKRSGPDAIPDVRTGGERTSAFTHHLTPQSLLEMAHTLYGHAPPGWLYSVGAANFDLGETLSPVVRKALPTVIAQIGERIRTYARI